MEILLIVICVILITLVLLQSSKAEGASQIITGGNTDLFKMTIEQVWEYGKERGSELFISRTTLVLGLVFLVVSLIMTMMY